MHIVSITRFNIATNLKQTVVMQIYKNSAGMRNIYALNLASVFEAHTSQPRES